MNLLERKWRFRVEFLHITHSTKYHIELNVICAEDTLWSAGQAMARRMGLKALESDLQKPKFQGQHMKDYALLDVVCQGEVTETGAILPRSSRPDSADSDDFDAASTGAIPRPVPPTRSGSVSEVLQRRNLIPVEQQTWPPKESRQRAIDLPTPDVDTTSHESQLARGPDLPSEDKRTEDGEHLQGL